MAKEAKKTFKRNAVADIVDFRDKLYTPTLVEVPVEISVKTFKGKTKSKLPVLDQGEEGSCTGYALATIAHYLLLTRKIYPDLEQVSPEMIYTLSKKYDEWKGEDYSGSSARGAMKAWHKHGICSQEAWDKGGNKKIFDTEKVKDALKRPLGAYFRVNHKDIVAMHSAIAETGILYVTLDTHKEWDAVGADGIIPFDLSNYKPDGLHAVAIIGYDTLGFWFQNSWGLSWGDKGYGHISYDDWLTNGYDVWVARLGAPVNVGQSSKISRSISQARSNQSSISNHKLRPHIVSIGNDGLLKEDGVFGNTEEELKTIFTDYFPAITKGWRKKRILLYAHGGLVPEETAIQRVADYHQTLLDNDIYPVFFVWHSGFWETMKDVLADTMKGRRAEGVLGDVWNFMLDKVDTMLESIARVPGKKIWEEMKENALLASTDKNGGALKTIMYINDILKNDKNAELHVIGHSAGSIFHAPLLQKLCSEDNITPSLFINDGNGLGQIAKTVTLWAPAITIELFEQTYLPLIEEKRIEQFNLFMLDDKTEQDDNCGGIYNKSLLYLVSNAFESHRKVPNSESSGEPILGMQKWMTRTLNSLFQNSFHHKIISPETGAYARSTAKAHGDFDDDAACLTTTIAFILDSGKGSKLKHKVEFDFNRSNASMKEKRIKLDKMSYKLGDVIVGEQK